MTEFLTTPQGRTLAFNRTAGTGPGVIFLGGFVSDMGGTKALHLEAWARAKGRTFIRFDYSGHGQSSGTFEGGSIGDWLADAAAMLEMAEGPQVLVGSSMGGWIALLLARAFPLRLRGLVTIAAAPDFTEDHIWAGFSDQQRATLIAEGRVVLPSDYAPEGYRITRHLVEEGRRHLILRAPLPLACPTRLLQGTADTDVRPEVALRLFDHATGSDIRLTLVKGADHRFSTPECLALMITAIEEVSG